MRIITPMLCLFCLVGGCQNTAGPASHPNTTARVIIGYDQTVYPPDARLLKMLGQELGCELQLLQTLGGNTQTYNCPTSDTEEVLAPKLDRLGSHEGVRYAEIDRKRKIQD